MTNEEFYMVKKSGQDDVLIALEKFVDDELGCSDRDIYCKETISDFIRNFMKKA